MEMEKYDIVLIAGKGPNTLETEDLKKTGMNPSLSSEQRKLIFSIDDFCYDPELLYLRTKNDRIKFLSKKHSDSPDIVSSVLSSLFVDKDILINSIDISNIWTDRKKKLFCDIVCLSTTFMWSEKMLDKSLEWVKKNISFNHIILGGQYSYLKRKYLFEKYPEVNFIITGDAETSLLDLIKCIEKDKPLDENALNSIYNLIYRNKYGETVETSKFYDDINNFSTPQFQGNYSKLPYISMKGCPFVCKFCALRVCSPKWRYLSYDRILEDFRLYKRQNNVTHIEINDSTFFIPFTRFINLLDPLATLNISWEANCRVDTPFTSEIINRLEKSNCKSLYFGFESMNDDVLGYMDKKVNVKQNKKINTLFKDSEINTMMSFIVGYPGESEKEYHDTYQYLINDHYGYFNIYVFELEDKTMPLWDDKEKFSLKLIDDQVGEYIWKHGGENWEHSGMNSQTAAQLRAKTIKDTRLQNSKSIHRSWQYQYVWNANKHFSRDDNLQIEKLINKLVFLNVDFDLKDERLSVLKDIVEKLENYNIFFYDQIF